MRNNVKNDIKKEPASITLVPGSFPAGVEFFWNFFNADKIDLAQ